MRTLYLCYQSLLDPLTQTQVVAYLEGLARVGYGPILVTFEPRRPSARDTDHWARHLRNLGIEWRWLRYHRRPTVPATAFDIARGVTLGAWLIARYGVRLIHARSHVPAVMAAALSAVTNRPFLFDVRGFLAEEYVDAQVWPADGFLFRWTKKIERFLVKRSQAVVVLTESAELKLRRWYRAELDGKPIEVIPCCVDRRSAPETGKAGEDREPAATAAEPTLVYVGKLGGWYPTGPMVEFFEAARRRMPGLKWTVLTQSDTTELLAHAGRLGLTSVITIGRVSPDDLLVALGRCSAGLCLYRRKRSAPACSPTKVPEYLAAGLPIVASRGVGDLDSIIGDSDQEPGESSTSHSPPIGVLVDEWGPGDFERAADELKPLLDDPHIRARCRSRARRYFDLEAIGWTRYRRIYGRVIGHPVPEKSMADAKCRPLGRSPGIDPVPAAEIGSIVD